MKKIVHNKTKTIEIKKPLKSKGFKNYLCPRLDSFCLVYQLFKSSVCQICVEC
jgi:hypothetical protein